jgi:hypothetical protein
MRKIANLLLVAVLLTLVAFAGASAQSSQPSSKVTAKVADIEVLKLDPKQQAWTTVLTNNIKTANQKDLFINPSLECGLYTQTKVASQKVDVASAMAKATVDVRVLVDGKAALPSRPNAADPKGDGVTFCRRAQQLTAALAGYETCTTDSVTGVVTCTVEDEWIDLMLDTMDANSFNYIYPDLASGVHKIEVQARISTNTAVSGASQLTGAEAKGYLGYGSVTVESVRMIKGEDVVDLP